MRTAARKLLEIFVSPQVMCQLLPEDQSGDPHAWKFTVSFPLQLKLDEAIALPSDRHSIITTRKPANNFFIFSLFLPAIR